ncbi:hypothetical protein HIM_00197 [Hirsutella minnesotensis 3608]|nr:hypothetical protein HIM_00197 [Hirsutella minnesotensis 3608]
MHRLPRIAAVLLFEFLGLVYSIPPDPASQVQVGKAPGSSGPPNLKPSLKVTILGDTNRDGKVDTAGDSDILGKETWTRDRGALFLATIVDTDRRCSIQITASTPNEDLEKCHDATDTVLRNPQYLAPLRTLPLRTLSDSAAGFVQVTNSTAAAKVRIFHHVNGRWAHVTPDYGFAANTLRSGLELGIDARDVRRPGGWDGRATVQFVVLDGVEEARDEVALRVAPVLTHHHGQLAEMLLTQSSNMSGIPDSGLTPFASPPNGVEGFRHDPWQATFVHNLGKECVSSGIDSGVFLFNDSDTRTDIWVQDYFEPGYMSIPGPEGPVSLRIMIRSAQDWRPTGRLPFLHLRSNTTGAIQYLADGTGIDSLGNLETIPPYTHNGTSFPAGRIVMGAYFGDEPKILSLLRAQEEQDPIIIDTSWLYVGHTDEFLQFLPADNDRGWVVMVSDPNVGLDLLQAAQRAGHGHVAALSRPPSLGGRPDCVPTHTLDQVLGMANFTEFQEFCAQVIDKNIDIIKKATGISDEHIIRVPQVFYDDSKPFTDQECEIDLGGLVVDKWHPYGKNQTISGGANGGITRRGLARGQQSQIFRRLDARQAGNPPHLRTLKRRRMASSTMNQVSSFYPGSVNGVVVGERKVIAANPWGPVVDGKDLLATAVREAYSRVNFTILFIDSWFSHHLGSGEVHCGSNTLRDMNHRWWQVT